jgi:iron complex outermembrane receptor protein
MAAMAAAQTSEQKKQEQISTLEEIVVTAQKRAENLQEVPIAVTALTSETRDIVGITTLEDITNFVPGLTYEGQLDRASIRGVGRVTNQPGTDPGVGLYSDGVYNSSTASAARNGIFIERIEVLRGPQGSLYGRNTTGGAINTITRGTKDSFGGEVRATYGAYDRKVIGATVTGPIADWFRFRVSAALTKQDDGYFTNLAPGHSNEGGNQDDKDYMAVMDFDLGSNIDLTVRYTHQEQWSLARYSAVFNQPAYSSATSTALFGTSLTTGAAITPATTFATRGGLQPSSLFNGIGVSPATVYTVPNPTTTDNRRVFSANVATERVLEHSNSYSPTLVWHLPSVDIKWIGAYTEYAFHSFSDTDAIAREGFDYQPMTNTGTVAAPVWTPTTGISPVHVFTGSRFRFYEDKEYTSNELNFTSTSEGSLQWLVGLYQYHERYEQIPIGLETSNPDQSQLHTVYARPAAAITGTPTQQLAAYNAMTQVAYDNPTGATSSSTGVSQADSYAVFGQMDWQLSDAWKTTIGGRVGRDEKQGSEQRFAVIWDPSTVGAAAKAYDNSAAADCFTDAKTPYSSANQNFQQTIDVATGQPIVLASTSTSYTPFCRTREFGESVWTDWTGTAGLEWKPSNDTLTYAKYSRGYKSGAVRFGGFALDAVTDPEHLNAFEVGVKSTIASRLQINTSVFYYDYRDYQFPISERVDNGSGGSSAVQTYTNLDKAEVYGAEVEMNWNPVSTLAVWLTYSYLHTEIKSDLYVVDANDLTGSLPGSNPDRIVVLANPLTGAPIVVAQNVKGNALPSSPENKASANVNYTFHFAAGSLTPSASYSWRDKQSSGGLSVSAFAREGNSTPAYGTADARITWTDADGHYSIIGSVANALNDETVNSASVDPTDASRTLYNLNPPRTWGVEFQYRFGSEKR